MDNEVENLIGEVTRRIQRDDESAVLSFCEDNTVKTDEFARLHTEYDGFTDPSSELVKEMDEYRILYNSHKFRAHLEKIGKQRRNKRRRARIASIKSQKKKRLAQFEKWLLVLRRLEQIQLANKKSIEELEKKRKTKKKEVNRLRKGIDDINLLLEIRKMRNRRYQIYTSDEFDYYVGCKNRIEALVASEEKFLYELSVLEDQAQKCQAENDIVCKQIHNHSLDVGTEFLSTTRRWGLILQRRKEWDSFIVERGAGSQIPTPEEIPPSRPSDKNWALFARNNRETSLLRKPADKT